MHLTYRGISYDYQPSLIETVESDLKARFLGSIYQIRRPVNCIATTRQSLKYRGTTY